METLIRRVGRISARYPWTRRALASVYRTLAPPVATIRSGHAAGMKIRTASANPGYRFGTTEPVVQDAVAEALAPDGVCYDLGANVGFFTLVAAKAVGPNGHVYSFEPNPPIAAELRRNVALNELPQVEVIEAAVSDQDGTAMLEGEGLSGKLSESGDRSVKTVRIDSLGLEPPDLIKIDVEGAEEDALKGLRETIEAHRPAILCEVHVVATVERAAEILAGWLPGDYRLVPLDPAEGRVWAPHFLATV